jgi:hypothetical protein
MSKSTELAIVTSSGGGERNEEVVRHATSTRLEILNSSDSCLHLHTGY